MSRLRIKLLAATTMIAAISFAGGTVAQASVIADESGTSSTVQLAYAAAKGVRNVDFYGCGAAIILSETQNPDGTWTVDIESTCEGVRGE